MKQFVVIWERIANSGYHIVHANSPQEAIQKIGYSPKYVKTTAMEIVSGCEVVTLGEAN